MKIQLNGAYISITILRHLHDNVSWYGVCHIRSVTVGGASGDRCQRVTGDHFTSFVVSLCVPSAIYQNFWGTDLYPSVFFFFFSAQLLLGWATGIWPFAVNVSSLILISVNLCLFSTIFPNYKLVIFSIKCLYMFLCACFFSFSLFFFYK